MAAAHTLITMTAQRRSSTSDDGVEHPCDAAMQDVIRDAPRICFLLLGRYRPPQGWADSSLDQPPRTLHLVGTRHLDGFQRTGNCLQMTPGQVQVDRGVGELGMTQQNLDRAQIGAGFEHVSSETVPERVRRHMLAHPSMLRGLGHGSPNNLLCDGYIGPPVVDRAGE